MSKNWQQSAVEELGHDLIDLTPLSGGDFAESFRGTLANGVSVFIKTHSNPPTAFFSTEAAGLRWLRDSHEVNVPQVLAVSDEPPYLVLEWVESGVHIQSTEAIFGQALARLHQAKHLHFGRPDGCLTGSLGLPNHSCDQWSEFYASCRLLPLAAIARDRNTLSANVVNSIESIAHRLEQLDVPGEPPSLLHGDLWAGNRLVDNQGESWLIDPAAHFGHREFDLAMMNLFGGFGQECFTAYHDVYPLDAGWHSRIKLHQLAPLVVHAIKFGGSYVDAVSDAVAIYT